LRREEEENNEDKISAWKEFKGVMSNGNFLLLGAIGGMQSGLFNAVEKRFNHPFFLIIYF